MSREEFFCARQKKKIKNGVKKNQSKDDERIDICANVVNEWMDG